MRGVLEFLSAGIVVTLLLVAGVGSAAEEKVPLDKVPPKVMEAVKARFPGAEITSVEKETEEGKVVYDIELKHKDRKYEMDIQEDGTVLEIEKEIAAKNLPEAVTTALNAKYPNATIKEVMEMIKVNGKEEKLYGYEVELVTADKKKLEIEFAPDGKILKSEKSDGK
jgi:uncharacterized membrane protein YkoI